MNHKKAVIFDLDGTLCNVEHRRHYVTSGGKKDWHQFNHPDNIMKDTPNEWCIELINMCISTNKEVIFVTGRQNSKPKTMATLLWLKENLSCSNTLYEMVNNKEWEPNLFMRGYRDGRNDSIIKEEIYRKDIEPNYNVLFVVDDRKRVTKMWRDMNVTCLQCDWGDF